MKVVLHTCCGPCASACVPRLKEQGHAVMMVFANSNIDTPEEFERRRAAAERLAAAEGLAFVHLPYDHEEWLREVAAGYENEPEKGRRCARCFRYSLKKVAEFAANHGQQAFTSSLTVSPHKVSSVIFEAGDACAAEREGLVYLHEDFKNKEGFKLSVVRTAELGLYRQSYCGCEFSRRDAAMKVILASGSPRRAKILTELGVPFAVVKTDAHEVSYPHDPERTVRENALAKGFAASGRHVLSADTIVWFNGRIYGKPRDLDEAKAFLRELSGNTHTVFTGVAFDGKVCVCRSDVSFRTLSDATIDAYISRVNPLDRAGAYDIDEAGEMLVERWTGSYENIMGLPVEPLREWGILPRQ